jgi:hypothetical protein
MKATIHKIEVAPMSATELSIAIARNLMIYNVEVSYGDDAEPETVQFYGSPTGAPGPVSLIVYPGKVSRRPSYAANFEDSEETEVTVENTVRFGVRFNEDWIRNFFSEEVDS